MSARLLVTYGQALNGGPWNPARAHAGRSLVINLYVHGAFAKAPSAEGVVAPAPVDVGVEPTPDAACGDVADAAGAPVHATAATPVTMSAPIAMSVAIRRKLLTPVRAMHHRRPASGASVSVVVESLHALARSPPRQPKRV